MDIFSKKQDGVFYERKKDTIRLIVGYSEKRAKRWLQ